MVSETTYDGVTVRYEHHFADYMPALAVGLLRAIGTPDDESTRFLFDFVGGCIDAKNGVFPDGLSRPACEMRVQRLLASPVQAGEVVFSLRSLERRRLHQKSKQLVSRRGTLEGLGLVGAANVASAEPSLPVPPPQRTTAPHLDVGRLEALERTVAALTEKLEGVEMMYGGGPAAAALPAPEALMPIHRRIMVAETNHKRLANFVLGVEPKYEPFVPQTDIPISNGEE